MTQTDREDLRPSWDKVGVHGVHRPREWDAVVVVDEPELRGDAISFIALEDGTVLVEEGEDEIALSPLADAIETEIPRPYRASAVRRGDALWAVSARKIATAEADADGDEIELSVHGTARTLLVDGDPAFGSVPVFERIGERVGDSYSVRAIRLDGDLWEVSADPL